jgi:hypothetical protein
MKLHVGVWLVAAIGAAVVGCGPNVEEACTAACEKANECTDTPEDCSDECSEAAEAADQSGCESEAAALYECVEAEATCEQTDVGEEVCQSELSEVFGCVISYCLDNPGEPACQ